MATEKTRQVLQDVANAIGDAEAQLPTARELVKIMRDAQEDTSEVQALVAEIEARIRQWKRVVEREGIDIPEAPPTETE